MKRNNVMKRIALVVLGAYFHLTGAPRSFAIALCLSAPGALAASVVHAVDVAKYVTAEEITGVVVEAETSKPIANAIVAIRFERNNTGHSGPHCFRSMAVEADAEGRFRFIPWTQDNTRANVTYGEVTAYKVGYAVPRPGVYVTQSRRTILGIAFSDTIRVPRQEVSIELKRFEGSEKDRLDELTRAADRFTCLWQSFNDNLILLSRIREEIVTNPSAQEKTLSGGRTWSNWLDTKIQDVQEAEKVNPK